MVTDPSDRVALALADLDDAGKPSDLDLPGYRLHPLKDAVNPSRGQGQKKEGYSCPRR